MAAMRRKLRLSTRLPKSPWEWLTVFKTNAGTYKWVCKDRFSQTAWLSEEEAVEDALKEWGL